MIAVRKKFKEISLSVSFRHSITLSFRNYKFQTDEVLLGHFVCVQLSITDISSHLRLLNSLFLNNFSYKPVANHSVTFSVGKFI